MNKENVLQTPPDMVPQGITEEQRTRITQNFRAAKALLARKRPRETLKIPNQSPQDVDAKRITSPGPVPGIHRDPLSEIPINTPSRIASKALRLLEDKRVKSCPGKMLVKNDFDNVNAQTKGAAMECTPTSQSGQYSLSEPLSLSSLLDEAFDESILTEIDALCDKPAAKVEEEGSYIGVSVGNQCSESSSGDDQSYLESAAVKKLSDHEEKLDHLESVTEGSDISGIIQCGSMPKPYLDYLQSLNDKQKEAACSDISVPLMIVAGPGSGKTSTMVGRILVLLNEGIGPSHVLAMTFTTAAASEMRDRIGAVAGKKVAKELTISTFHSFSLQLCRLHAEKLGRTSEFSIYGHAQQRRAIFEAMRLYENERMNRKNHEGHKLGEDFSGVNCPQNFQDKSKKWQKFVTQAKASGKTPAEFREMGDDIGAVILGNYNDILKSCNALDYHDLITCSVKLLTDFPEVFRECQESWNAIVIDEFQDTSSMQYSLLRILASQNRITIVGDEDQSIFSFNGADISGFDSFRENFPNHKEIRLNKNYRSTRCIVEAASSLIHNNVKRCQQKQVFTDNSSGSKITVKECHNEVAQCAFVVDKILEATSDGSTAECSFGNIAILYRRQVSGKVFQAAFRGRRIPFNVHGVAFYRKKIIKAILAMLRTTLPGCDDTSFRQVFKALLPCGKEEKKAVIGHIEKISAVRNCSFISTAHDIFTAKVSGTFKRNQLTQGRSVLLTMEMISKLVQREQSISAVITSVANMLPQKYLLEQRAIVDVDSGKLLNEDNDLRSVLQYLLDDVSDFLAVYFRNEEAEKNCIVGKKGCTSVLKAFIDYISTRERENFRSRRRENEDSVTLTTIHQSKGLEWDIVFIVKANESEIPLLHQFKSELSESGSSVEEERRLLYVAMTRARKKLYILYVILDSNWQLLQPSRFLKEIPDNLMDAQDNVSEKELQMVPVVFSKDLCQSNVALPSHEESARANSVKNEFPYVQDDEACLKESAELTEACIGNGFLRRFPAEERSIISHLFHQWAKKKAFRDPQRLLNKVGFVVDERLRIKASKNKNLLCSLKSCLRCDEAFQYAEYVLKWEQIPADKRAHLIREKQEHFQKLRMENAMGSSAATTKQIAYLQSLGCTVVPTSRLHASRLIEQYKSI